ncbi:MAG TPA: alcohol dehydrogenase catalytic domain-containing protein [Rhizomicrobium sp.]|nr:alcohol dehydrogenase catalytic domain-containing protein [Rhizomicrobium sp.]
MKAAVFHALHQPLAVEDVHDPAPAAGEVVIKVGRCGICGSDLHMTEEPAFGTQPGAILGHEFAGEVVACGKGVDGLRVGDRVAAAPLRGCGECPTCQRGEPAWCASMMLQGGGYGEFTATTAHQCRKLPSTTSLEDGALVEPLAVALHGVMLSEMKPGARVLVMGAGPIGLGCAFWAKRLGAAKVVVSDISTVQRDLAMTVGATDFLKVEDDRFDRVKHLLGGPPDIVFECVGRPGILAEALEHVAVHGMIVMLGLCTALDSFVPFRAVTKEVRFVTSAFFTMREYEAALDMLDGGHAPPHAMISETVLLAEMPAAFEALKKRTTQCKVMVKPH